MSVMKIATLLGIEWLGIWQYNIIDHVMSNKYSTVQCPRQVGKSFVMALILTMYIIAGKKVIIGAPTKTQGTRIIIRQVSDFMHKLECLLPIKRKIDNVAEIVWDNGASILALSANKVAQREGFSANIILFDEAHRMTSEILPIFLPFLNVAMKDEYESQHAKVILNGVGGHKNSLIELMKEQNGGIYKEFRLCDNDISTKDTRYFSVFAEQKEILTSDEYNVMYKCLPMMGNSRYCFPLIQDNIEPTDIYRAYDNVIPLLLFGCDVGREHDQTVVTVTEIRGEDVEVIDVLRMSKTSFPEQAKKIYEFINKYPYMEKHILVEGNGLGVGLIDCLKDGYFKNVRKVNMTYNLKDYLINLLRRKVEHEHFAIREEKGRNELESVTVSVKDNGDLKWSHSDILSSTIVSLCGLQNVKGFLPYKNEVN